MAPELDPWYDEEVALDADAVPPPSAPPRARRRPGRAPRPLARKAIPAEAASEARTAALRQAQGIEGVKGAAGWRDELSLGSRSRAAARLASGARTHRSDSGFGLA